ncbi:hypothetical protein [Nocardia africana]|uniref:Virulence factor Mce family protein n=1 Tax=Nocardia africana TaxID=134964 RepID=A0A378X054_9NOCA|nr:hypothetical protein [Nocardia africana]MCC3312293.1 Mammalian cell entry related domain protein [Nocardia africana]SUA46397.1 Uncharacterised protein [Nocardia africana]
MLRGTEQSRARIFAAIGAGFLATVVAAATAAVVFRPDGHAGRMELTIETPYVGEGVIVGTSLNLHGLSVGEVTAVTSVPGGGVRLRADLEPGRISGLTDAVGIDFRPANYFGVTAINLVPGEGGMPLRDGQVLDRVPEGNFTMQALLSRLGTVSGGVLTTDLVRVVDKATRYTDGLTPLIETGLSAAAAVAEVQRVRTSVLMANAASISEAFPPFLDGAVKATQGLVGTEVSTTSEQEYRQGVIPSLDLIANSLFGAVGHLLSGHEAELLPATRILTVLSGTTAVLVDSAGIGSRAEELRNRLGNLFGVEGRPVQVHIVLDRLPALAAPLSLLGATPQETR